MYIYIILVLFKENIWYTLYIMERQDIHTRQSLWGNGARYMLLVLLSKAEMQYICCNNKSWTTWKFSDIIIINCIRYLRLLINYGNENIKRKKLSVRKTNVNELSLIIKILLEKNWHCATIRLAKRNMGDILQQLFHWIRTNNWLLYREKKVEVFTTVNYN